MDELVQGRWYFVDGYSSTSIVASMDQTIPDNSNPGVGGINVSGQITATLQYMEGFVSDSIVAYSFSNQAGFDSTSFPYGEFIALGTDLFGSWVYTYYYYHYMNADSKIEFLSSDSIINIYQGQNDTTYVNPITMYGFGYDTLFGIPFPVVDSSLTVDISGALIPQYLDIDANTPVPYNYSSNNYDYVSYFSLDFDDNGILYGQLEMDYAGYTLSDTLEIQYDILNDTLIVQGGWYFGQTSFGEIDSIHISVYQNMDQMSLVFEFDPCVVSGDSTCYSLYEGIIGLQDSTLTSIVSRDSLVFSQLQPLRLLNKKHDFFDRINRIIYMVNTLNF